MGAARFEVRVAAPFRLDLTCWALRRRAHNAVDVWDGTSWRRVVDLGGGVAELTVHQDARRTSSVLVAELRLKGGGPNEAQLGAARRLVSQTLGLDVEMSGFSAVAERDPRLAALARRFAGMRPPRFPTLFEAIVNAVACQQLSLEVGIHLLNRLAERLGPRLHPAGPAGFPGPERLAGVKPAELRALGFSRTKATTLITVAQVASTGRLDLELLSALDDAEALAWLAALPGIGRWSAEYVLLRGLGRLEVLPGDDVGARNSLRRRFGLSPDAGYEEVATLAQTWWPYGGLVYFHLLLDGLAAAGRLEASPDAAPAEAGTAGQGGVVA